MPRNRKAVGAQGESTAAAFLESRGYRLVDANVRPEGGMARGEIDLIAWHGEFLVFIEVKTRHAAWGAQGAPMEAVDARKRRQLLALAAAYLARHALDDVQCRFDVVEIVETKDGFARFRLLPDAFTAMDSAD
ncbi:MAG: YraN family protein [Armatimonadetes bacterium]|nr:YraN family protein [Armatimonadota bacterium]